MTGIIKTDQLQGAQGSSVTVPTGHTFAVTSNATVGGTLSVTGDVTATNTSGNRTLGIITGTSNSSILNMGDTDAANVGQVKYHHGINSMVLRTNGSDKVTLDSTGNLLFNAASTGVYLGVTSATASNLLDDYEEGTFTPTLVSSGSTFAYSVQQGIYTKVGDLVTFNIVVQLDGGGNSFSSNSVALNGWPFTSRNSQGANARFFIHGRYLNVDTSGSYYYAFADLNGNSSSAPLKEGGDNIPIANLGANRLSSSSGQLYLHGHYYTDS